MLSFTSQTISSVLAGLMRANRAGVVIRSPYPCARKRLSRIFSRCALPPQFVLQEWLGKIGLHSAFLTTVLRANTPKSRTETLRQVALCVQPRRGSGFSTLLGISVQLRTGLR